MQRTRATTLAWAGDGATHLRDLMLRLGDDAFAARSLLPGWSRAHLLSHVARNADAMVNLLTWARTGVPTPAYRSDEQRDADIAAGATRPPAAIRADVIESSDRLADAAREMPEAAWSAQVQMRGRTIPAAAVLWLRAVEMWVHSVDLDVGASFADLPGPMLLELVDESVAAMNRSDQRPDLRLSTADGEHAWQLGEQTSAQVCGPVHELVAWLLGRSNGRPLRRTGLQRLPALPPWR